MQTISARIGLISGLWEWRYLQLAAVDFFLKALLAHLAQSLHISNNNPVFKPVYTVCINR
jgi:hypothetical protein